MDIDTTARPADDAHLWAALDAAGTPASRQQAKAAIVEHHLPFAYHLGYDYARSHGTPAFDMDDLLQEFAAVLTKCVDTYDRTGTFAGWVGVCARAVERTFERSRQRVTQAYATRSNERRAWAIRQRLRTELRREPTLAEIGAEMGDGLPSEPATIALLLCPPTVTFPDGYDLAGSAQDAWDMLVAGSGLTPEQALLAGEKPLPLVALERAWQHVTPRQQEVLELVMLRGRSFTEAGTELGISRQAVGQHVKVIRQRVRAELDALTAADSADLAA